MSDTRTLTLVEFLTARLDEEQARSAFGRMLVDVDAKRRIVQATEGAVEKAMSEPAYQPVAFALLGVASLLALPYADHPDYREEWRP